MQPAAAKRWTLVAWGGAVLWSVLALFLVAVTFATFLVARNARDDHVLSVGLQTAIGLQRVLRTAGPPAGPERLATLLERFEAPDVLYVEIVGGGLVIASTANGPATPPSPTAVLSALRRGEAVIHDTEDALERTVHDVYVPLRRAGPKPRRAVDGTPFPDPDPAALDAGWGFRPGHAVVRVGIDPAPARWLNRWASAQAVASVLAILALGIVLLRARRTARALSLLEEQRRRREVLARLGEVSAVLAHEIRNPLAALKGHVQLAAEGLERAEPASNLSDRLMVAIDEAGRVEDLVRGLLDYAREPNLSRSPVAVAAVVRDAVASLDASMGPYPHLEIDCPEDLVASLDRDQVTRVVANLVQNAREAAGPDGRVRLTARESGPDLILLAEDSGPGVPETLHDRVFDPFVTGKVRGVGLGLAIVTRIVEAHDGGVTADRSPTLGGARFALRLPLWGHVR